jgi:hypothetical protein
MGCYYLQYVPASNPFDHAWFEVVEAILLHPDFAPMKVDEQAVALYRGLTVWCGCALQTLRHACAVKDLDLRNNHAHPEWSSCHLRRAAVLCELPWSDQSSGSCLVLVNLNPIREVGEGRPFVCRRAERVLENKPKLWNKYHSSNLRTFQEIIPVRTPNSGTTIKTVSIPERNELSVTNYTVTQGEFWRNFPQSVLVLFYAVWRKCVVFKSFMGI